MEADTHSQRQTRQARQQAILADARAEDDSHTDAESRARAARVRAQGEGRGPGAVAAFLVDVDTALSSLKVDIPDALR